jgi:hypothetical protein
MGTFAATAITIYRQPTEENKSLPFSLFRPQKTNRSYRFLSAEFRKCGDMDIET